MNKSLLAATLLIFSSFGALADPAPDKLQKGLEYTMTDILCSTSVIKDMDAAGQKYFSVRGMAKNSEEEHKLKSEFGKELQAIWLRQNYKIEHRQDVVTFLNHLLTLPMADQAEFAKSWTFAAHKLCPAVAENYRATFSAAMTLISTIPY